MKVQELLESADEFAGFTKQQVNKLEEFISDSIGDLAEITSISKTRSSEKGDFDAAIVFDGADGKEAKGHIFFTVMKNGSSVSDFKIVDATGRNFPQNPKISEAAMKAVSVQIKNKMGVYKKFKSFEAPGAREWSQNWDETADKPKKAKAAKPKKVTDDDISEMADHALTSALDGGDPMDALTDWMRETGVEMDDIDRVVNKEHKLKGGLYAYIARSWQDMQNDRDEDSSNNPWGSTK